MGPARNLDGLHRSVVVIGAGQAGLAMSYCLVHRGIDHLVLERHELGHDWAERRWDSFRLVSPNWQCQLPGFGYQGNDQNGFMSGDHVVAYLRAYARSFGPPLVEGVEATALRRDPVGGFRIDTSAGRLTADQVVLATGAYQVPLRPRFADRLPRDIVAVHSSEYRSPERLPQGAVLVVGSGQSGCQIAEELHLAGRRVHLAVGGAPRMARRYRGRDIVAWLDDMECYRRPAEEVPAADVLRFRADHYVSGVAGGHDIDLRELGRQGMRLHGRLVDVHGGLARFDNDLARNLDAADAVSEGIKDAVDAHICRAGIGVATEERYLPVWEPTEEPAELDLAAAGIASVVWATGFGQDHRWTQEPVLDDRGYPTHNRGVTGCPGLYFLGLPWQHTWGSARFAGVGADARYLADRIAALRAGGAGDLRWLAGTPARPAGAERTVA